MMDRLMQYWISREPRERMLLAACCALLLLAVLYGCWAPLAREQQRQQRRVPQLQQDMQRMQQMAAQWKNSSASQPQQDWRAASQARLVTSGVSAQQAKLLGTDADVQRWQFEKVAFNAFLDWLGGLYNDAGVRVKSVRLEPAGPGNVNATLELYHP